MLHELNINRLKMIVEKIDLVETVVDSFRIKPNELLTDKSYQGMVGHIVLAIAEQVYKLDGDFRDKYDTVLLNRVVPWDKIAELRNELVYPYTEANWEVIIEVVFNDLPMLKNDCIAIIKGRA